MDSEFINQWNSTIETLEKRHSEQSKINNQLWENNKFLLEKIQSLTKIVMKLEEKMMNGGE